MNCVELVTIDDVYVESNEVFNFDVTPVNTLDVVNGKSISFTIYDNDG